VRVSFIVSFDLSRSGYARSMPNDRRDSVQPERILSRDARRGSGRLQGPGTVFCPKRSETGAFTGLEPPVAGEGAWELVALARQGPGALHGPESLGDSSSPPGGQTQRPALLVDRPVHLRSYFEGKLVRHPLGVAERQRP
jgi:hypothetical protein